MAATPKEPQIINETLPTELVHETVLTDIDALVKGTQSAIGPKTGEYMKKTWERIDCYWTVLEKAHVQHGWLDDQDNKQKAELLSRLIGRRDDSHITVRFIYQAAIDHLKRKPESLHGRAVKHAIIMKIEHQAHAA